MKYSQCEFSIFGVTHSSFTTNQKFVVTDTSVKSGPIDVFMIRAIKDIPRHRVKAGDYGGFVEHERNLSPDGDCWIAGNAVAANWSHVSGDALLKDDAKLLDRASIHERCVIADNVRMAGSSSAWGNAYIGKRAALFGPTTIVGGSWEVTPFQMSTNYYHVNWVTPQFLRVGCRWQLPQAWLDEFESEELRERYHRWELEEMAEAVKAAVRWKREVYMKQESVVENGSAGKSDPKNINYVLTSRGLHLLAADHTRHSETKSEGLTT